MATNIALPSSGAVLNTGKNPTYLNPAIIVGAILVPYSWNAAMNDYDVSENVIARFVSTLKGGLVDPDPNLRFRYIGPFENVENQNVDKKTEELGYGKRTITDRAKKYDMYRFVEGGFQYFSYVLSYRNQIRKYKLIYFDANGVCYTAPVRNTVSGDPSKELRIVGIKGMELSMFYPNDWMAATQDASPMYTVEIGLKNPIEWNEDLLAIETGTDLLSLCEEYAVQGVDLTLDSIEDGGIVNFTMRTALGKIDLADELPDIIDVTSFIARNKDTGNTIDIDSVTYNSTTKTVSVTLDTADPDYIPGDNATIALVDVTALATAGFSYYESNAMLFEMPGL